MLSGVWRLKIYSHKSLSTNQVSNAFEKQQNIGIHFLIRIACQCSNGSGFDLYLM